VKRNLPGSVMKVRREQCETVIRVVD
jgi:hypothetical protein